MTFVTILYIFACIFQPNVVYGDESELANLYQCPYNDFCTRNRTKTDELPSGYKPCCPTCYCDAMCFQFRDCCPDVDVTSRPVTKTVFPVCLPPFHHTAYTYDNVFTVEEQGFFQKRCCPDAYVSTSTDPDRETINRNCIGRGRLENLDEYLLVSNRNQPTEVFGNKYCAACNGVNDTIQWNLKVRDCSYLVTLVNDRPALDFLAEYLLDNCYLESVPPDNLQSLERIKCWLNQPYENTCDLHSQWASSSQGERIKKACEQSTYEHVFIDNDADGTGSTIYASYKCYLCENGPDKTPADICTDEVVRNDLNEATNNSLTVILDGSEMLGSWPPTIDDAPRWLSPSEQCSGDELYNQYMDQCATLTCPSHMILVDQQCVPIGQTMYGVDLVIQLRFLVQSKSTKAPSDKGYSFHTINQLKERLGLTEFDITESEMKLFYNDESFENLICLTMEYYLPTSSERPLEYTIKTVRELLEQDIDWTLTIGDFVYHLSGEVDFLDTKAFDNDTFVRRHLFLEDLYEWQPVLHDGLYVCQHVIYIATEYCSLQDLLYAASCPDDVFDLKIDSKLMKGFYILTPDSFGICTDTLDKYLAEVATQVIEDKGTSFDDGKSHSDNEMIHVDNNKTNAVHSSAPVGRTNQMVPTWLILILTVFRHVKSIYNGCIVLEF